MEVVCYINTAGHAPGDSALRIVSIYQPILAFSVEHNQESCQPLNRNLRQQQ